ncbi:MAG: zinc ribbon domain-containing protein [Promethearchaeota archaeon]
MHTYKAIVLVFNDWIPQKILKQLISEYKSLIKYEGKTVFFGERLFETIVPIWIRHMKIKFTFNKAFLNKKNPEKFYKINRILNKLIFNNILLKEKITVINIGYTLYHQYEIDNVNTTLQIIKNFKKALNDLNESKNNYGLIIEGNTDFSSYVKWYDDKKSGFSMLLVTIDLSGKPIKTPWDSYNWLPKNLTEIMSSKSFEILKYPEIDSHDLLNLNKEDSKNLVLKNKFFDTKICPKCGVEITNVDLFCLKCGYYFKEFNQHDVIDNLEFFIGGNTIKDKDS